MNTQVISEITYIIILENMKRKKGRILKMIIL